MATMLGDRPVADGVAPVGRLCHRLVNEDIGQLVTVSLQLSQRAMTNRARGVILDLTGVKLHERAIHVLGSMRRTLRRRGLRLYLIIGADGPNKFVFAETEGVSHHEDLASARKASEEDVDTEAE